jgi:hypothetical protein
MKDDQVVVTQEVSLPAQNITFHRI